jgi:WD40 repeat protein
VSLQDVEENRKVWLAWMQGTSVPDAPLQFALDGTRLLLLFAKTDLAIWKLEPGGRATLGVRIKAESAGWVAAALSPDGRRVAACDEAGALRLWNADDGQPILTVHGERGKGIRHLRFSPDGRWLAACVDATGVVVWDSVLGKVVRRWEGHRDRIRDLAFRPDGLLVTASSDGIKTWGPWTDEGERTLKAPFSVEALAFSPDGGRLFGRSEKGMIAAWDLGAGRPLWTAGKEGPWLVAWALEPGGKRLLVTGPDGDLTWLNSDTGEELGKLSNGPRGSTHLALGPHGLLLAMREEGPWDPWTELWDVHSGWRLYHVPTAPAFTGSSPNGKLVASGGSNGLIKVTAVADGKELLTLAGHTGDTGLVNAHAFSPDGRRLASGDGHNVLKLWDLSTGAELLTYRAARGGIRAVAFSPDGGLLGVGDGDGVVHLLDARPVTPALREEREVRALLDYWHTQLLTPEKVAERIRADDSLSESVRGQMLKLAPLYRHDLKEIHDAAWETVARPGATPEQYRLALRQAELAAKLDPDCKSVRAQDTLGAAYYRVGEFQKARDHFSPQVEPPEKRSEKGLVLPRAFAAMSLHRLGEYERARAVLNDLRATMKLPAFAEDERNRALFREAEVLLGD